MKILLTVWMCMFLGVLTISMVACSKDEAGSRTYDMVTVNGKACRVINASICFHGSVTDSNGETEISPHSSMSMQLVIDGAWHKFMMSLDGVPEVTKMKIGKNLVKDKQVTVCQFSPLNSIELSTRYENECGCVFINEISDQYLIMDFNTFSFVKDMGSTCKKYTLDGVIKVEFEH